MMRKTIHLIAVIVITLLTANCASSRYSESTGEYFDSSATTAKVKTRLIETLGSKALAIKVKTYKDDVQLSGFVNDVSIKRRAGRVAAGTIGVKQVRNDLVVK
jgi:osmotically-inducible protein OsmY